MNKNFTHFSFILFLLICLASCQDGNFRYLEPLNGKNCLLVKEYSYKSGKKRYLLNEYEYQDSSHVARMTHYTTAGQQSQSRFEYDSDGKLVKLYDQLVINKEGEQADGYLVYKYDANGDVEILGYYLADGNEVLQQHILLFYNAKNQVDRIISSYGTLTRLEYDAKGNVAKVYFTPYQGVEYLKEEYTGYNNKTPNALHEILNLRNIYMNPLGCYFSQNQALSYKIYNEDGSLKKSYSQRYEYDYYGNYTRFSSNATGAANIVDAEYNCR